MVVVVRGIYVDARIFYVVSQIVVFNNPRARLPVPLHVILGTYKFHNGSSSPS